MTIRHPYPWVALGAVLAGAGALPAGAQLFDLPPRPPPYVYGNLLIDRLSSRNGQPAAAFSHWTHRRHHTCRVCHIELGFAMARNQTPITEARNQAGEYCGACHDGRIAFAHEPGTCKWCHNANRFIGIETYASEAHKLPRAPYGNRIDWVAAIRNGAIHPARSLYDPDSRPIPFRRRLDLGADWALIPPAYFPHAAHLEWLDCASCHPQPFNVKRKTTRHFSMRFILQGKFCGMCHLSVAFPLDNCRRCHPGMHDSGGASPAP